jgi:hypothetical protein
MIQQNQSTINDDIIENFDTEDMKFCDYCEMMNYNSTLAYGSLGGVYRKH